MNLPARADHIGSLLRPKKLRDAFRKHSMGQIPDAEQFLQYCGRDVGALLAGLADERLHARARQQHADLQGRRLRAHDSER